MVRSPPIALDFSLGHVGPRKPVQTGFLSVLPRAEASEVPSWRQSMTLPPANERECEAIISPVVDICWPTLGLQLLSPVCSLIPLLCSKESVALRSLRLVFQEGTAWLSGV